MNNNTVHDNFRKQLTNVHALTVLTISLIEIIGYVVLVYTNREEFSFESKFFRYSVALPTIINICTHIAARVIVNSAKITRRAKNAIIIAAALVTSLVIAVIHKEYIIACGAFVFPIILSAMFNDRKLLNASFLTSLGILVCVGVAFRLENNPINNLEFARAFRICYCCFPLWKYIYQFF